MHELPAFATPEEWERWLENELVAALPAGWTWRRSSSYVPASRRCWEVAPPEAPSGLLEEFTIELSANADTVLVYCENSDAGFGGPHLLVQRARVIQREVLALSPLRDLLRWIFEKCEPNVHGLT